MLMLTCPTVPGKDTMVCNNHIALVTSSATKTLHCGQAFSLGDIVSNERSTYYIYIYTHESKFKLLRLITEGPKP